MLFFLVMNVGNIDGMKYFYLPVLFIIFQLVVNAKSEDELVVKTKLGEIQGLKVPYYDTDIRAFLGVPFATPPLGELRFKRPLPVEPWDNLINATSLKPACEQYSPYPYQGIDDLPGKSEDCLYLNIWAPSAEVVKRPVFYFIYSGGFSFGSNRLPIYDGRALASVGDMIVVTPNQRVASFGFLYTGTEDAPGNVGLYDLLLGLKWVYENIEAFGGDPNKITIGGHSSGAQVCTFFIVSSLAKGLFNRAILESGTFAQLYDGKETNLQYGQKLAEFVGCANETVTIRNSPKQVVECLRGTNATTLAHMNYKVNPDSPKTFQVVFGDPIVGIDPIKELKDGDFGDKSLLMGNVADELSYVLTTSYKTIFGFFGEKDTFINKTFAAHVIKNLALGHVDHKDDVINYYLGSISDTDFESIRRQTYLAISDVILICPEVYFAEKFSRSNNVYYYYFKRRPSNSQWAPWMGVVHYDEVKFVFGRPTVETNQYYRGEQILSIDMMLKWSNFVNTGVPEKDWPKYDSKTHQARILDLPGSEINQEEPHIPACNFLRPYFTRLDAQNI